LCTVELVCKYLYITKWVKLSQDLQKIYENRTIILKFSINSVKNEEKILDLYQKDL
jgi:hypothetical protein